MFDIGFLEILIVLIIALLVIGPQRMPEVARKLGGFMGKTKRFIDSVKQEGHLQETVDELKKSMDIQEEKKNLQNLENDLFESMNQPVQEIDMETFKRPTFGGAEPTENTGGSQFSKAPSQPQMPTPPDAQSDKPEAAPSETPTEKPVASVDKRSQDSATAQAEQPASPDKTESKNNS